VLVLLKENGWVVTR